VVSTGAMVYAGVITHKNGFYWVAVLSVTLIFLYQQWLAWSPDIALGVKNFFKANMYISPILFLGTLTDVFF
jgi:4-hydroxybenzoate polyprenyltransferase